MISEVSIRSKRLYSELSAHSVALNTMIEDNVAISSEVSAITRQLDMLLIEAKQDVSSVIWLRAGTSQHIHNNLSLLSGLGVDSDNELTLNGKKVYDGSKNPEIEIPTTPTGGDSFWVEDENGDLIPKSKEDGTARGVKAKRLYIPNSDGSEIIYQLYVGELGEGADTPSEGGGSNVTFVIPDSNSQYGILYVDGTQVGVLSINGHKHTSSDINGLDALLEEKQDKITKDNKLDYDLLKNIPDLSTLEEFTIITDQDGNVIRIDTNVGMQIGDDTSVLGKLSMGTLVIPNSEGVVGEYTLEVGLLGAGADTPEGGGGTADFSQIKVYDTNDLPLGNGSSSGKITLVPYPVVPTKVSAFDNDEGYLKEKDIENKVDKVDGKGLSTEDFTTALKNKLQGLSNYDDSAINDKIDGIQGQIDTLVKGDAATAIESFNEIIAFLDGVEDTETLEGIIAAIEQQIASKVSTETFNALATRVGTAETAIATNATAIATNKTNIATNKTDISNLKTRADGLQSDIEDVQDDVTAILNDYISKSVEDKQEIASPLYIKNSLTMNRLYLPNEDNEPSSYELMVGALGAGADTPEGGSGGIAQVTIKVNDESYKSNASGEVTLPNYPIIPTWNTLEGKPTLAVVATSGSYNDLSDKPTIPSAVTESTVSGWGFTKNTGTYSKPPTGIPKTHLESAVQASLGKADTALQEHQDISELLKVVSEGGDSLALTDGEGNVYSVITTQYSLPLAANGTRGGIQVGFTTNAANRNYAVQLSGEKAYVNVPWSNTTYSAGDGIIINNNVISLELSEQGGLIFDQGLAVGEILISNVYNLQETLNGKQPLITASNKLDYTLISGTPTSLPASDVSSWAKKSSLAASDVPNLSWNKITSDKPTTLSGYGITDALSTSGGTIEGGSGIYTPLEIKNTNLSEVWIQLTDAQGKVYIGSDKGVPSVYIEGGGNKALIHTGNYSDYALPLSGGKIITGSFTLADGVNITNSKGYGILVYDAANTAVGVGTVGAKTRIRSNDSALIHERQGTDYAILDQSNALTLLTNGNTLIHSGNIGNQSVDAATRLSRSTGLSDANTITFTDYSLRWYSGIANTATNLPSFSGYQNGLLALPLHSSGTTAQIYMTAGSNLYFRGNTDANWEAVAFTSDLENYLSKEGGTISGMLLIENAGWGSQLGIINTTANSDMLIRYYTQNTNNFIGAIGFNTNYEPIVNIRDVGNKALIHSGNIATQRVANADTLDDLHAADFARYVAGANYDANTISDGVYGGKLFGGSNWQRNYNAYLSAGTGNYKMQFNSVDNILFFRSGGTNTLSNMDWKTIAFTDSNVESATKLQTARTIWGQSFDGTGNVSGALYDVNGEEFLWSSGAIVRLGTGTAANGHSTYIDGNNIYLRYGTTYKDGIALTSSGNVLIGTTTDISNGRAKLQVKGHSEIDGTLYFTNASSRPLLFTTDGSYNADITYSGNQLQIHNVSFLGTYGNTNSIDFGYGGGQVSTTSTTWVSISKGALELGKAKTTIGATTYPRFGRFDRNEGALILQLGKANAFEVIDKDWTKVCFGVGDTGIYVNGNISASGYQLPTDAPSNPVNGGYYLYVGTLGAGATIS